MMASIDNIDHKSLKELIELCKTHKQKYSGKRKSELILLLTNNNTTTTTTTNNTTTNNNNNTITNNNNLGKILLNGDNPKIDYIFDNLVKLFHLNSETNRDRVVFILNSRYGLDYTIAKIKMERNKLYDYLIWINGLDVYWTMRIKLFETLLVNNLVLDVIKKNHEILMIDYKYSFDEIDLFGIWDMDSLVRLKYYTLFIFKQWCKQTHNIFLTKNNIKELYHLPKNNFHNYDNYKKYILRLEDCIFFLDELVEDNYLVLYGSNYYLNKYYNYEKDIASILSVLPKVAPITNNNVSKNEIDGSLTTEHIMAINGIMCNKVSILLGRAGTGKTSSVILNICKHIYTKFKNRIKIIFTTPTHAAKNNGYNILNSKLDCVDHINFNVIQYLISSNDDGISRLEELLEKGNVGLIFIDEMSMVDTKIFYKLITICKKWLVHGLLKIVLIGDHNQLDPYGIGSPFVELVDILPTFRLTKNLRSNGSDIPQFCDMILGESVLGDSWSLEPFKNVHFLFENSENSINHAFIKLLNNLKYDGYVPYSINSTTNKTFQVISPINVECENICPLIRKIFLNRDSKKVYEIGDPIMLRYNTNLFKNGDLAKIVEITNNQYYTIRLDDSSSMDKISYRVDISILGNGDIRLPLKYIKPSLARTVHSSQGLGFDVVIYVMKRPGYYNITRNMNYTAYSRSKKELYLLGYSNGFTYNKARLVNSKRNSILGELTNGTLATDNKYMG